MRVVWEEGLRKNGGWDGLLCRVFTEVTKYAELYLLRP